MATPTPSHTSIFEAAAQKFRHRLNHRDPQGNPHVGSGAARKQPDYGEGAMGDVDDPTEEESSSAAARTQSMPSSSTTETIGIMLDSTRDGVMKPLYRVLHLTRPQWTWYQDHMKKLGFHARDTWQEGAVVSLNATRQKKKKSVWFKPLGVISPRSTFAHFWISFIMLCDLTYASFLVPVAVAFCDQRQGHLDWCQLTEVIFGTAYLANLYFGFSIGYVLVSGHKNLRLCHRRLIARVYIIHGSFWSDVLTLVPWLYMILFSLHILPASQTLNYARILLSLRMIRVIPMIKQLLINAYSSPTSNIMPATSATSLYTLTVAYVAALVVNLFACLVYAMAKYEGFKHSWIRRYDFNFSSVPPVPNILQSSEVRKYILSVYWIITTMTTVGYGDIVPVRWPEQVIMVLVMLTGATVFGILVSSISEALGQASAGFRRSQLLRTKLADVRGWLRRRQVGLDLRRDILAWYSFSWQQNQELSQEEEILTGLPHTLRNDMLCHITRPILKQIQLFGLGLIDPTTKDTGLDNPDLRWGNSLKKKASFLINGPRQYWRSFRQRLDEGGDGPPPALDNAPDYMFSHNSVKPLSPFSHSASSPFTNGLTQTAPHTPTGAKRPTTSQPESTVVLVDSGASRPSTTAPNDDFTIRSSNGSAWAAVKSTWEQLKTITALNANAARAEKGGEIYEDLPVKMPKGYVEDCGGKGAGGFGQSSGAGSDKGNQERSQVKGQSLGTPPPSLNSTQRRGSSNRLEPDDSVDEQKVIQDRWLSLLSGVMSPMQAVPLQDICVEGALCDRFWILEEGEVHVIKHARARYRKGDREKETWVGVTDPAEETQRTTLRATPTRPLVLGHGAFLRLQIPECMYSLQTMRAKTFCQLWVVRMDHFRPILKRNADFEECIMENLKLEMVAHLRLSRSPDRPWVDMCFFLERALKPELRIKLARKLSALSWMGSKRQLISLIRCIVRASWKKNVQPIEELINRRSTLEYQPSFNQYGNVVLRNRALTMGSLDEDTIKLLDKYRQQPGEQYTAISPRSSDSSPEKSALDSPSASTRYRGSNSSRSLKQHRNGTDDQVSLRGPGSRSRHGNLQHHMRQAANLDPGRLSPGGSSSSSRSLRTTEWPDVSAHGGGVHDGRVRKLARGGSAPADSLCEQLLGPAHAGLLHSESVNASAHGGSVHGESVHGSAHGRSVRGEVVHGSAHGGLIYGEGGHGTGRESRAGLQSGLGSCSLQSERSENASHRVQTEQVVGVGLRHGYSDAHMATGLDLVSKRAGSGSCVEVDVARPPNSMGLNAASNLLESRSGRVEGMQVLRDADRGEGRNLPDRPFENLGGVPSMRCVERAVVGARDRQSSEGDVQPSRGGDGAREQVGTGQSEGTVGASDDFGGQEWPDSDVTDEASVHSVKSHRSGKSEASKSDGSARKVAPGKLKFRFERKLVLKPRRARSGVKVDKEEVGSGEREDARGGK